MNITRRALISLSATHLLTAGPAFQTGVPAATKDKPQSKLWQAYGSWWALLPMKAGPSLWKRASTGWQRQHHLDSFLSGLPGQADALTNGNTVAAVLIEDTRLAVIRLIWNSAQANYQPAASPIILSDHKGIETATIADAAGRLWIAYNSRRHMWARPAEPDSQPVQLSETPAKDDDICQIVAFAGSVGVIWSDQERDAVFLRRLSNSKWLPAETAASGGKTADDHISSAVASNGTLYVATKNSVDALNEPQFVLRIRTPQGRWSNLSYAPLTATESPTRPIALLSPDQRTLHLLHTVGHRGAKPARSSIVRLSTPASAPRLDTPVRTIIQGPAQINNVTGPKTGAGLVLASDNKGSIYEALIN